MKYVNICKEIGTNLLKPFSPFPTTFKPGFRWIRAIVFSDTKCHKKRLSQNENSIGDRDLHHASDP